MRRRRLAGTTDPERRRRRMQTCTRGARRRASARGREGRGCTTGGATCSALWCDVNTPELPRVVIPQLGEWSHRLDRTPSGERHSAAVAAFFRPPSPPPSLASTRSSSPEYSPEYSPESSDGEMDAPPPSPPQSPESDAAWYVRLGGDCPRPRVATLLRVATERQGGDPRQGGGLRPHARWLRQPNGWRPTPAKRATTNNAKTMIT